MLLKCFCLPSRLWSCKAEFCWQSAKTNKKEPFWKTGCTAKLFLSLKKGFYHSAWQNHFVVAALHVPDCYPERDAMIGAMAIVYGMTVVTRNVKDFPAIVSLLNPWER